MLDFEWSLHLEMQITTNIQCIDHFSFMSDEIDYGSKLRCKTFSDYIS